MRTFRLAVLVTLSMATGVAFVDAGVRGGGAASGGSGPSRGMSYTPPAPVAAAPSAPSAAGRHHGAGHSGGHAPATTYHYGAWDFAPSDARPAPQAEYRASAVYNPVHINIEPVTIRREYSQRQVSRYWRRYFGNHYRYASRRAMPLGPTAKIIRIKDFDRKATPLRPLSKAAPKPARYSARYTSFVQLSSR